jgi:hypothetical protein
MQHLFFDDVIDHRQSQVDVLRFYDLATIHENVVDEKGPLSSLTMLCHFALDHRPEKKERVEKEFRQDHPRIEKTSLDLSVHKDDVFDVVDANEDEVKRIPTRL